MWPHEPGERARRGTLSLASFSLAHTAMPWSCRRLLPVLLAAVLALPALADTVPAPASVQDGAVVWAPEAPFVEAAVVVHGPAGQEYRRSFAAGERLAFDPAGLDAPLADGFYIYDLVLVLGEASESGERPAVTQSGSFEVHHGHAVESAAMAYFHTADGSIQGSLCIGVDCSASESFGFDTLRLKENNLRIHFDDTSNSGSFPSTDWGIELNSSSNGGQSYFRVLNRTSGTYPFTIFNGAGNNALVVDADGDLGIGVQSAVVEIHVADGDTPTLRLEQDGSSGFAQRTWDVAGNETNFFVRDVTNASALPLRILAGSPGNQVLVGPSGVEVNKQSNSGSPKAGFGFFANGISGTDELFVGFDDIADVAGNTVFEVNGDTDGDGTEDEIARFRSDVRVDNSLSVIGDLSDETFAFRVTNTANAPAQILNLTPSGDLTTAGTVNGTSDANVKENVVPVDAEAVLQGVAGLPISTWEYIATDGVAHMGPMAQDFYRAFGLGQGETTIAMVDADGVALAAIQALLARDEAAQARVAELEAANAALAERLARIEALLEAAHE